MLAALLALLAALLLAPAARAADVPEGARWSEATITAPDGTELHADILRPAHLAEDARTPVILSIGPYFNHAGQVGAAGPIQGATYDPVSPPSGPSDRFHDLVEGGRLMERGYTFVMVDLRGFGGSTGCLDWSGPGEQLDVVTAVEWAAEQPWSTGRVGMYGKSYDGLTGLIGAAHEPEGLEAVVSQEPVYDLYRYLYSNRVRYANSLGTPALYDLIAGTPGPLAGDPGYTASSLNDLQRPGCPALNWLDQQNDDPEAEYWQQRDFIDRVEGSKVPVFLTQGFLENNTKPDGAFETFGNLAGDKRAWFGMWDHVRGNDTDEDGRLLMGRAGWFDEVMRWYDHHLKGGPAPKDPRMVIQTSDGTFRSEQAWPPADARDRVSALNAGTYTDDGENNGTGSGAGNGIWTVSTPLPHDAHLAGIPRVAVDVTVQAPRANLVANVYDIDPDGEAILVSRGTTRVDESGVVELDLLGNDWKLPRGHRVGVLLSSSNSEWWLHVPTMQTVEIASASVRLPFLRRARTKRIAGEPAVKLEEYREQAPFTVDAETIAAAEREDFALPPRMTGDRRPPRPQPTD
jgi:predicted acyl esterase